jgi:hypothetical protein
VDCCHLTDEIVNQPCSVTLTKYVADVHPFATGTGTGTGTLIFMLLRRHSSLLLESRRRGKGSFDAQLLSYFKKCYYLYLFEFETQKKFARSVQCDMIQIFLCHFLAFDDLRDVNTWKRSGRQARMWHSFSAFTSLLP